MRTIITIYADTVISDLVHARMHSMGKLRLDLPLVLKNNNTSSPVLGSDIVAGTLLQTPLGRMRCLNMLAITRNADERPVNAKLSSQQE